MFPTLCLCHEKSDDECYNTCGSGHRPRLRRPCGERVDQNTHPFPAFWLGCARRDGTQSSLGGWPSARRQFRCRRSSCTSEQSSLDRSDRHVRVHEAGTKSRTEIRTIKQYYIKKYKAVVGAIVHIQYTITITDITRARK